MDLTDQQWQVVEPLFSMQAIDSEHMGTHPGKIGRPSYTPRSILDAVLWKIRTASPWYGLPAHYPSPQTVYRRYRHWRRIHLLDQIFLVLYEDLVNRGGFNLQNALLDGSISVQTDGNRLGVVLRGFSGYLAALYRFGFHPDCHFQVPEKQVFFLQSNLSLTFCQ
jgi:transposase